MADDHPLKKYRLHHGLTQGALAKQLGVTTAAICRWEKRTRAPRRKDLPRIAESTGIAPIDLLGLPQSEAAE